MRVGYVRDQPGFPASVQRQMLVAEGVPNGRIWEEGKDAESLETCLHGMRKVIDLECAKGMRSLGSDRDSICDLVDVIHAAGKCVLDPATGKRSGPGDGHGMLRDALKDINAEKTGIRKHASEIGRKGGLAKGAAGLTYEKSSADRKTWRSKEFSTDTEAAGALGYSATFIRSVYGSSGRKRGAKPKQ